MGTVTRPARIIDAHHHVWDLSIRDQPWISGARMSPLRRSFDIADLEPQALAVGVEATVVVQTVTEPGETPELLALADRHDLVAGVVGWTDLTAPNVGAVLDELRGLPGGHRLVGLRHPVQAEPDSAWLVRPEVGRGLAAVATAGLTYDLLVRPHHLPVAAEVAVAVPGLTFVLDHLGKPPISSGDLRPWAADLRRLAALPNVVCKLSGMVTEAAPDSWTVADLRPFAAEVLAAFGPDRVMFGSDWPVCRLAAAYAEVVDTACALTSCLTATEQAAVFRETAERTYRLADIRR